MVPLQCRLRNAYNKTTHSHLSSSSGRPNSSGKTKERVDSDQPEAVYSWLDDFENSIAQKSIGTPFDYPVAKYEQSKKLTSSQGYKKVKRMQL